MLPHLDGAVGLTVEPVPGWQRTYLCLDPLQVEAGSERQDAPIDLAAPSELIGLPQSEDVLGAMKVVDPEVEQGSGQALVFELVVLANRMGVGTPTTNGLPHFGRADFPPVVAPPRSADR